VKRKFLNKTKPDPEDIWYVSVNNKMVPKEGYQEVFDEVACNAKDKFLK